MLVIAADPDAAAAATVLLMRQQTNKRIESTVPVPVAATDECDLLMLVIAMANRRQANRIDW